MSTAKVEVSGGLSLPAAILVVFLILKLVGVVAWSWFWVLAPLWISVILSIVGTVVGSWILGSIGRRWFNKAFGRW